MKRSGFRRARSAGFKSETTGDSKIRRTLLPDPIRDQAESILWQVLQATTQDERRIAVGQLLEAPLLGDRHYTCIEWASIIVQRRLPNGTSLGRRQDAAQDLVISACNRLVTDDWDLFKEIRNRGSYEPGELTRVFSDMLEWLALDVRQRKQREKKRDSRYVSIDHVLSAEANGIEFKHRPNPIHQVDARIDIERALTKLNPPSHDLQILRGHFFEGASDEEIAGELGRRPENVKLRRYRLLKALGEVMAKLNKSG